MKKLKPKQIETVKQLFERGYTWTHQLASVGDGFTLSEVTALGKQQRETIALMQEKIASGTFTPAIREAITDGYHLLGMRIKGEVESISKQPFIVRESEGAVVDRSGEIERLNIQLTEARATCEAIGINFT
jgi:hypothetical protein